ncbi:class E sortase [Mumia zhuanghuii]|uniref:Class E sortase n=2 Tax=Mumia zhuanghuii TaxID=2585211 RepID=A0A5C4MPL7_9ACTN|nr:class E sortase [Mumia zhuanghuii]TNC47187.1 class E sortase [Mumia zhuanghuii]
MLVGVGLLAYVGWQYFGTNIIAKQQQAQVREDLVRSWDAPASERDELPGGAIALMRVSRFGDDVEVPVVKGVGDRALARGVGWFPDSAGPGEVGNFAVAGHRVTHGEPFRHFLELRKGDEVVVETRTHVYTYVLRDDGTDRELDFSEGWVLDPVPGEPGAQPTERLITLVTCSELFHTDKRSVVFGELARAERK